MQTAQESLFDRSTRATEAELSRIFKEALWAINAVWIPGAMAYIERNNKPLLDKMNQVEDALERVWKLAIGGYLEISDFEEAVSIWRDAHLLAVESFKARAGG